MAGFVVPLIALCAAAAVVAVVVLVGLAVWREDRHYSLIGEAPDWLSRGARRLNGVGRRDLDPELLRPVRELVR